MNYCICYQGFKVMGELGGGIKGEEDAGEIDAHGCAVCGSNVCAVQEVGGGRTRLEVRGPGDRVEGLRGGEEEESLLLFKAGRGVWRRGWVVGLG